MPHFRHCCGIVLTLRRTIFPSQISFHHSKKCYNIMVWRFCLYNMKKWGAMPLGLIIFLLFNKYLGVPSVLESKRHLTYAGHLAALMGNRVLLSQLFAHAIRLSHMPPLLVAFTRLGDKKNAICFSCCNSSSLLELQRGKIIGKIFLPLLII